MKTMENGQVSRSVGLGWGGVNEVTSVLFSKLYTGNPSIRHTVSRRGKIENSTCCYWSWRREEI